jgi:hypothetical protein
MAGTMKPSLLGEVRTGKGMRRLIFAGMLSMTGVVATHADPAALAGAPTEDGMKLFALH